MSFIEDLLELAQALRKLPAALEVERAAVAARVAEAVGGTISLTADGAIELTDAQCGALAARVSMSAVEFAPARSWTSIVGIPIRRAVPPAQLISAALGLIDKTRDNIEEVSPDVTWRNDEVRELLENIRTTLCTGNAAPSPVHACPPSGSGLMPCCRRTPFEVARTDRMTLDPSEVTCSADPSAGHESGSKS